MIDSTKVRQAMVVGAVAALVFLGVVGVACYAYKNRRRSAQARDLNTTELSMVRFRTGLNNENDSDQAVTNGDIVDNSGNDNLGLTAFNVSSGRRLVLSGIQETHG